MNKHFGKYHTGGALVYGHPAYIERESDRRIIELIHQMQYVKIIEPRQQGKTSFLNRIMAIMEDYLFSYIDMSSLIDKRNTEEGEWYRKLCSSILRKLVFFSKEEHPEIACSGNEWKDFILGIGELARKYDKPIVLVLDALGDATFPWCEFFFRIIRAIFNERSTQSAFQYIAFIFSGAFNVRTLISDHKTSPFNISKRIRLPDFNLDQTASLVEYLGVHEELKLELSRRIQYWADGQPYITECLCEYLDELNNERSISSKDVDEGVRYFIQNDMNHFQKMIDYVEKNPNLNKYLTKILKRKVKPQMAVANPHIADLEIGGIIKGDENDLCKIRNRIHEKIFNEYFLNSEEEEKMTSGFKHGYALIIGIADYQKINKLPKIVVKDAKDIYKVITSKDYCGYFPENTQRLLDHEATGDNILQGLKWLAQSSNSESTALIFFSGHGGRIGAGNQVKNYLIPIDANGEDIEGIGEAIQ